MDSKERLKIANAYRTKNELEYLGGFFTGALDEAFRELLPKGFSNVDLEGITLPELYEKVDYVEKQRRMLSASLDGFMWRMGESEDFDKWFTTETLNGMNSSKISKTIDKLREYGVTVSDIEAGIMYYMLGMDGKGMRTPEETAKIRRFKSGTKYVSAIAEAIANDEMYDIIKCSLEAQN